MKKIICVLLLFFFAFSCEEYQMNNQLTNDDVNLKKGVQLVYTDEFTGTVPSILGGDSDWLISLPDSWNTAPARYMVVYAHAIVDPDFPVGIQSESFGGKPIKQIVNEMGMGYATTSFGDNGLVADKAVEDIVALVTQIDQFFVDHPEYQSPEHLFLVGFSEGGLTTVKTVEIYPELFNGAISINGPIGNYYDQLQYFGDFHVLFNYFFEEELQDKYHKYVGNPMDGVGGQDSTMGDWNDGELQKIIFQLMIENPDKVRQLLKCAGIKVDEDDPYQLENAIFQLLRYNVKLTNDLTTRLQGVPFNNIDTWYEGSDDDILLNANIQRILTADYPVARSNVNKFETTGLITIPLINIHNTDNHVIPYWQAKDYKHKITEDKYRKLYYTEMKVKDFGHYNNSVPESYLTDALSLLKEKVSN